MAKRWKFVLLPAFASVVAATLFGCGGSGKPSTKEYEASVVETRDRVDLAMTRIPQAKSKDDLLDRLDEAGAVIDDAAGDFDEDGAPTRFEDESEKLVRDLRQLAADLHGTAAEARDLGFDKLLKGASGLNFESWDRVNADLGALRRQGIEVQPLGRH